MNVNRNHFSIVNQADLNGENTVLIIGAATDGPTRVPILLNDKYDPTDLFGNCPLSEAYTAVKGAGATKIITYRMNGAHSTAIIESTTSETVRNVIRLTSVSAGSKYNDIAITVYPDYIYIDETAVGGSTRSYFFDQYPTAYDLVYGINRDAYYGLISITAEQLAPNFPMANIVTSAFRVLFQEGDDENQFFVDRSIEGAVSNYVSVAKERLAEVLFGSDPDDQSNFSPNGALAGLNYGVVVLADMYHDESIDYANMLGSFCLNKGKETDSGCIGVIGTSPLYEVSAENILDKVKSLIDISTAANDTEQNKYVQIVVGDSYYSESMPNVPNAYGYAGAQSFYPYHIMMTNKKITGLGYLNWQIGKEDVALLSSNGYICIVPSIRRGFVPYLAVTYFKDKTSAMSKPHCVRISQYVSKSLMFEFDDLIGSVSDFITQKEIVKTAEFVLQKLVDGNVLKSFAAKCDFTPGDNEATISVSVVVYSEVTAITSTTTITFPVGVI